MKTVCLLINEKVIAVRLFVIIYSQMKFSHNRQVWENVYKGCHCLEDPLEKEMATRSRILAWEISRTEEPGGLQFLGSQRVGHD